MTQVILAQGGQHASRQRPTLAERAIDVRRGVLLALRAAKAPVADGVRDGRALLRIVKEQQGDAVQLEKLIRELTLSAPSLVLPDDRAALASRMYAHLANLLPQAMTADEFAALDLFANPPVEYIRSHVCKGRRQNNLFSRF